MNFREWLGVRACRKEDLDRFFDEGRNNWARFDPELGYLLHDCTIQDGVDGSVSRYTYGRGGERKVIQYGESPCRINTYGNSFTQCHQVSDGETWQEILAAHIGEPIRNFGVGGYGVYQAYRRLLRMEATKQRAENIIFYIWYDDHRRSLFPCRWLFTNQWSKNRKHQGMFHSTPWVHLSVDFDSGNFVEEPNLFPTRESLYRLCQGEAVFETFKSNPIVNLEAMKEGVSDIDKDLVRGLADWAGMSFEKVSLSGADGRSNIEELIRIVSHRATCFILERLFAFGRENQKNLLILLGYGGGEVRRSLMGAERIDGDIIEFLRGRNCRYFDILERHLRDFEDFRLSPKDYVNRYYIGHYNPLGNHFFAFAIKAEVVDWLNPTPPAYRREGDGIQFTGYLSR